MQKVICINEIETTSHHNQIDIGKVYYLEISSVNGDYEGDWYGKIYADKEKENYIGHLKLSHFRSIE